MNQLPFPFSLFPAYDASAANPVVDMWTRVGNVYKNSMQAASQELWTSSARIIQEHTSKVWLEASQSCMKALAENAAAVQQRAFSQMVSDNRQAAEIVTSEVKSTMENALQTTH